MDKIQRYIKSLGFSPQWTYNVIYDEDNNIIGVEKNDRIRFDVRIREQAQNGTYPEYPGAIYYPHDHSEFMAFGDVNDGPFPAEDVSVIIHEFGHALHDATLIYGTSYTNDDTKGIGEGFADYLAISYRRCLQTNPYLPNNRSNWIMPYHWPSEDNVTVEPVSTAKYPNNWGTSSYEKQDVWTSTLMDLEYNDGTDPNSGVNLGRDVTTTLALESFKSLSSLDDVLENIYVIMQADRDIYDGIHLAEIEEVFYNRGFFTGYEVSGTILSNTLWSNYKLVTGTVTVPMGDTLTIDPNTFLFFENNSSLIVYGTLNVNGISSNKVILDFISPNSNNGIKVYSGGVANINYAEIKNAYYGAYSNEGEVNINKSDIKDCYYGIYLYRTNYASNWSDISYCNIYKTNYNGLGVGVYCNYSSPIITNTEVSNYYTGIGTIYNSSPLLGHYTANGKNNLHDNFNNLHSISNSNPFLGTTSYGGYYSLYTYLNKNIIAQTNCNIYADNNYWGSTSSTEIAGGILTYSGSSVDFTPFLTWNPNSKSSLPTIDKSKIQLEQITSITYDLKNVPEMILVGELEKAIEICGSSISENKDDQTVLYALDLLWQIERKMKLEEDKKNTNPFIELQTSENNLAVGYSKLIEAVGQKANRISALDDVISNFGSLEIIEKGVIYSKFLYYLNEEIDIKKAKEQIQILNAKYPTDPITEETISAIGSNFSTEKLKKFNNEHESSLSEIPITFELHDNYPNPFNPSTTISYSIPSTSNINITIYDMMGRTVRLFERNGQSTGNHSFVWDGTKENGELVSSGIYIYKFSAISLEGEGKSFEKTSKLLLMK